MCVCVLCCVCVCVCVCSTHVHYCFFLAAAYSFVHGGGVLLACEDFGRIFNHSFPACAFKFFFLVEMNSRTLIPLFTPGSIHSGSASRDDCGRVFREALSTKPHPRPACFTVHKTRQRLFEEDLKKTKLKMVRGGRQ